MSGVKSLAYFQRKHPDLTVLQIARRHRVWLEPLLDVLENTPEVEMTRKFMHGQDVQRKRDVKTIQKVLRKASLLAMSNAGEVPIKRERIQLRGLKAR